MEKDKQPTKYFPPSVRSAMVQAGVVLSPEELELAAQVEQSLKSEGVNIPGSLSETPPPTSTGIIPNPLYGEDD